MVARLFPDERFHSLWIVLVTTGLRIGEALALRWSDVSIEAQTLHVRRSLRRHKGQGITFADTKTKQSWRTVELSDVACWALIAQKERLVFDEKKARGGWIDHGLAFPSSVGTPLDVRKVRRALVKAVEAANLPRIRVHDLRHTAATLMLQRGVHPKVVQEMLGHSSIHMTLNTYSHVVPTMHREAANQMDTLFCEPVT